MLKWFKKYWKELLSVIFLFGMLYLYVGCEPKTKSLLDDKRYITRAELQIELDRIMSLAEARMADLDKQEQLRNIILNNAVLLASGQPLNPVGLITAVAGIYGVVTAGSNIGKKVKTAIKKDK